MMEHTILRWFVFGCCVLLGSSDLYEGSSCVARETGKKGTCKFITDCQSAFDGIRKGKFPQICSFVGDQSIVCCLDDTTTTSTVRTTTRRANNRKPGVISAKKCQEYQQYIWKVEANPTFLIGGEDIVTYDCPFDRQELIVGGIPAQRREFPHMVQIGYGDDKSAITWACGGSLISDVYVLTAAHCIDDRSLGFAEHARMGIIDIEDEDHLQQFRIVQRLAHPDYEEPSHYHDIGLVKLDSSVDLNTWVRPACIHTEYSIQYSNSIASGWGRKEFAGQESPFLLKVTLEMFDQQRCNKTYKSQAGTNRLLGGIKDDLMLCAGSSTDLKDTCQGDSGGPLQVYKGETKELACLYDIIGVTAFGKACGLVKNVPGVYTRVSHYTKWIEDNVWP